MWEEQVGEEQTCIAGSAWLYIDANTGDVLKATVRRSGFYPIDPSDINTGWVIK
jgi:hypothetical protein